MGRRTVSQHAISTSGIDSTKDYDSERDYYNRRYKDLDRTRRCTGLYEDSTESQINRMEGLWKEINNFFHWMCNEYMVKKVSSVTTYWHQLSQVYIKYKGRRINPLVLKNVYKVYKPSFKGRRIQLMVTDKFIVGPLAQKHGLDDSEMDKPILDAEDFL
ncbi:MAG: hypothetical protein Q9164_002615 [Protoblastenia rupestris]